MVEDPVGRTLKFWGREGQIVGVVEDFHFSSLHTAIEPAIIRIDPNQVWMLYVRTAAGRTAEAIAGLESVYKTFNPDYPL